MKLMDNMIKAVTFYQGFHGLRQGLNGLIGSYWSDLGLEPVKCCNYYNYADLFSVGNKNQNFFTIHCM